MSVDHVLRAIVSLTCMYTAGLFITLTSIATMSVAGHDPYCGVGGCMTASVERQYISPAWPESQRVKAAAADRLVTRRI